MKKTIFICISIFFITQMYAQRSAFFVWKGNNYTIYYTDEVDSVTFITDMPKIFDNISLHYTYTNYLYTMYQQYLATQGMSGEGGIRVWYGNYPGADYQKCGQTSWAPLFNQTYHEKTSSIYTYYPWYYYYNVINEGYKFLYDLDKGWGVTEKDRFNYKMQVIIMRAYSYMMLAQLYCKRWIDSNNGECQGLPLISDSCQIDDILSMNFVSLKNVYQEIYSLVDEVEKMRNTSLYDESYFSYVDFYCKAPGMDAAYAIKARAALNREDWETAAKYANLAKINYPLMDNETYINGGFNDNTSETIWAISGSVEHPLYYYSFFAYQGSNATSNSARNYPCAISKELIDKIPDTDIRKTMFLIPTSSELSECNSKGRSVRDLYNRAFRDYENKLNDKSHVYAYMQFKFQASDNLNGHMTIFRSSEMYLTEAEADYHLGKEAEARALLNQLNNMRNPYYNCTLSGESLLDEIKLYRRFELWGEGFDWFDLKRWKQPMIRHSFSEGGSFADEFAVTVFPEEANEWVWVLPVDYGKE